MAAIGLVAIGIALNDGVHLAHTLSSEKIVAVPGALVRDSRFVPAICPEPISVAQQHPYFRLRRDLPPLRPL